jgi:crotonobetainyl-CoA:carnitine CoA-transferase CaiB-like acyl-CoA transferase
MTSPALPLAGLTVVELGSSIAAPFGASVLADLGADIIKIERPPTGDDARLWGPPFVGGSSPMFQAVNRNKRSVAIDLKNAEQLQSLKDFIETSVDIVLQNMRPGVVESYNIDAKSLRAVKPSLIYCNLSAYGATGPLRAKPGYDPLMQAAAGIMSVTGTEGQEPIRVGPSIVDQGAGMWAVIGILAALRRRHATGEGCEIDTSLYETAINWVGLHVATHFASGKTPIRMGSENAGIAPYKAFEAEDGWLVIAAGNDGLFLRLAEALGRPEWTADPDFRTNADRVRNRARLNALISVVVAGAARGTWLAKLDAAGVPCAPVLSIDQVVAQPQTRAVGMLQEVPGGAFPLVGLPLSFDGVRPPLRSPAPALGQDSAILLAATMKERAS